MKRSGEHMLSEDRFKSRSAFFQYEFRTFGAFLCYLGLWLILFYFVPDSIYHHQTTRMVVEKVSATIPMINLFAARSPNPALVSFFMAIQWLMVPLHIGFGVYKSLGRTGPMPTMSAFDRFVLLPGTLLVAVAPIFIFPDSTTMTGTRMARLLARLESSMFLSFCNSIFWPANTAVLCYLSLALMYAYYRPATNHRKR